MSGEAGGSSAIAMVVMGLGRLVSQVVLAQLCAPRHCLTEGQVFISIWSVGSKACDVNRLQMGLISLVLVQATPVAKKDRYVFFIDFIQHQITD